MITTTPSTEELHQRNRRVEADKAWEVSKTRRICIAIVTYLTAVLFLWLINSPDFLVTALVPAGGYILSTLSLGWIKRIWLKHNS